MKHKLSLSAVALVCLLLLAGCAGSTPTAPADQAVSQDTIGTLGLLADADPSVSALSLYLYNGETVRVRTIYDEKQEQTILDQLNSCTAQSAPDADLSQWSVPCYGLWIARNNGQSLNVAWYDGQWLDSDGAIWSVPADFGTLWDEADDASEEELSPGELPNADQLSRVNDLFRVPARNPAREPAPIDSDEIILRVDDYSDGELLLTLTNGSDAEFSYSEYYSLDVFEDGRWFEVFPYAEVCFNDIANLLPAGESQPVTRSLRHFLPLEAGKYRLNMDDLSVEFRLNEQGELDNGSASGTVSMTAEVDSDQQAAVVLSNNTDEDTCYDLSIALWKQNNGSWEEVPFAEPYGICGMKDPLPAHEQVTLTFDLNVFGRLEPGRYQLELTSLDCSASFEITP